MTERVKIVTDEDVEPPATDEDAERDTDPADEDEG